MSPEPTPPRTPRLRTWNDFATLARDARRFRTTIVQIDTSQDHAALLKTLNDTTRPYAVCILKAQ